MAENIKHKDGSPKTGKVKLYVVEEQEILLDAYRTVLPSDPTVEVVGMSGNCHQEDILDALVDINPDVLLWGIKMLQPSTITQLGAIREHFPDMGVVLLSTLYNTQSIKQLRKFAKNNSKGCAFILKHSVDTMGQLLQVVHSVVSGQVIFDSVIVEGLIGDGEAKSAFLKEFTQRELEVLGLMAKGYRNAMIAEILSVDTKTVERHINSIYSKLDMSSEIKHPRVSATMLYLRATGQLPGDIFIEA
ncbi:MAG: response regulator transcription factor [Chloroflexota bacterium]|nr:response regulator transcription factor [Chloroflexota bacterium]